MGRLGVWHRVAEMGWGVMLGATLFFTILAMAGLFGLSSRSMAPDHSAIEMTAGSALR